jgi:uncharacterized membrane protein YbhN (UPF0104 family)
MPQAMIAPHAAPAQRRAWLGRGLGLALLAFLLWRLDAAQVAALLRRTDLRLLALVILALLPLIWLKTVRWQAILAGAGLRYALWPAYLAYFGSLFVGLLTPGRLGEFVKMMHVQAECGATMAQALTSVLADRLFDLAALVVVGGLALLALPQLGGQVGLGLGLILVGTLAGGWLLLDRRGFAWLQAVGGRLGKLGHTLLGPEGWLTQVHVGLRQLTRRKWAMATALTAIAYALYFGQCYLLARAMGLAVGVGPVVYAVALGSLVTLLPISISGLGTREATIIAYLGAAGVQAEAALGFSLLVFATFYLGSGLLGLIAWWLKPAPWPQQWQKGQQA